MSQESVRFRYGPPRAVSISIIVAGVTVGVVSILDAIRGTDISTPFGLVTLSVEQTRWYNLAGGVFCLAFAAYPALLLARHFLIKQIIELKTDSIAVPKSGWSAQVIVVPFDQVRQVKLSRSFIVMRLVVVFDGGEVAIADSWLPHRSDLDTICRLLRGRVHCEVPVV